MRCIKRSLIKNGTYLKKETKHGLGGSEGPPKKTKNKKTENKQFHSFKILSKYMKYTFWKNIIFNCLKF